MSDGASESAGGTTHVVAIDGPAGTGKSSVSKLLAAEVGASYLDTGAMYRAVTLAVLDAGVALDDPAGIARVVADVGESQFLADAHKLIATYYTMENPTAFESDAVEHHVEIESEQVRLRGFIDRIDVAPTGIA